MSNPQHDILQHYLNGGSLTVMECLRRFGTTELRRVNSRIKGDLAARGYRLESMRMPEQNHKRYWVVKA